MKSSASEPSLSGSFLSVTVNNSPIPLPMQDGLIYFRHVCSWGLNGEEGLFEKKEKMLFSKNWALDGCFSKQVDITFFHELKESKCEKAQARELGLTQTKKKNKTIQAGKLK